MYKKENCRFDGQYIEYKYISNVNKYIMYIGWTWYHSDLLLEKNN